MFSRGAGENFYKGCKKSAENKKRDGLNRLEKNEFFRVASDCRGDCIPFSCLFYFAISFIFGFRQSIAI